MDLIGVYSTKEEAVLIQVQENNLFLGLNKTLKGPLKLGETGTTIINVLHMAQWLTRTFWFSVS